MAKPGKYAHILPNLPFTTSEHEDFDEQQRINAVKDVLTGPPIQSEIPLESVEEVIREYSQDVNQSMGRIIESLKVAMNGDTKTSNLARVYELFSIAWDEFTKQKSNLDLFDAALTQIMEQQFENEGVKGIRLDSGRLVSVTPEPYAKVVDPAAYQKWLIDNGYGPKLGVHWGVTNSIAKERAVLGEPEPDGIELKRRMKISMRNS